MRLNLGLTFLPGNKFDPETAMPICLPTKKSFRDTGRAATAVGMGIIASAKRCFTDANGPEVFQPCATQWVGPSFLGKNKYGRYKFTQRGCMKTDPPSSLNEICRNYHQKIESLK